MMKGPYRLALLLGLIAFAPASLDAEPAPGHASEPGVAAVRVINNYVSTVKVYVEDAEGRLHRLGRVARRDVKTLEIPAEIEALGDYRVKVFPADPVWSLMPQDEGVRTPDLRLREGMVLNFWVEPNLANSVLELTNG